jgi:hypothetical protein
MEQVLAGHDGQGRAQGYDAKDNENKLQHARSHPLVGWWIGKLVDW